MNEAKTNRGFSRTPSGVGPERPGPQGQERT
jgi:hypothetical protein